MEHLSSSMEHQDQVENGEETKYRKLCSKGYSQREISHILQVGLATSYMHYYC
jgi:transposase